MIDVEDALWMILAAPVVGSFMAVLIHRLPIGAPVVLARSACPHCGTRLSGWEMVPLVSFVLLRGRCRGCRKPIGLSHPAVELAAVGIAVWAALVDRNPGWLWVDCGLGWTLLTLAWIDCASFLLPDVLTLPLLLAGLTVTFVSGPGELTQHCLAAGLGYLSFRESPSATGGCVAGTGWAAATQN